MTNPFVASSHQSIVTDAVSSLLAGGIVCVPTESSYGLAVDAENRDAIERLVALKSRHAAAAFGLIACSSEQAKSWTGPWPGYAVSLADRFWPGALTLVLPPRQSVSPRLLGPSGGIALRVSSVAIVREIANSLGRPITATSANPSGAAAATSVSEARSYFGDGVSLYVDGGMCSGVPSTLVEFGVDGSPRVLRQGAVELPTHL